MDTQELAGIFDETDIRLTKHRMTVAELLFDAEKPRHFTADSLLQQLRERGVKLSAATLYNIIHAFHEAGLIKRIDKAQPGAAVYDTDVRPHAHFLNIDTGEYADIPGGIAPDLSGTEPPENTRIIGTNVTVLVQNTHPPQT